MTTAVIKLIGLYVQIAQIRAGKKTMPCVLVDTVNQKQVHCVYDVPRELQLWVK